MKFLSFPMKPPKPWSPNKTILRHDLNCPYCLNPISANGSSNFRSFHCFYCPGDLTIIFNEYQDYTPMTLYMYPSFDKPYYLSYDIVDQFLSIILLDYSAGDFIPDYIPIKSFNYPHNSPRLIYNTVKRIVKLNAFL